VGPVTVVMVPASESIEADCRLLALGHRPVGQRLDEDSRRQGIEEVEQTRSDSNRGGGVPMIQDVEVRVMAVRCRTVSHGSLMVCRAPRSGSMPREIEISQMRTILIPGAASPGRGQHDFITASQ
jgi:hypothetical protein